MSVWTIIAIAASTESSPAGSLPSPPPQSWQSATRGARAMIRQRVGTVGGPPRGRAVGIGVAMAALVLVAGCAIQINNPTGFGTGVTPSATAAPTAPNPTPFTGP